MIPGAGHLYLGYRRAGWALVSVSILSVLPVGLLAAALFVTNDIAIAIRVAEPFLEHPALLLGLLAVNGAVLVFRVATIVDAFRLAAGSDLRRRWRPVATTVVLAMLAVIVVAPHAWAARRNMALYDLATYDFTADPGFGDTTAAPGTTQAPTTTDVTPATRPTRLATTVPDPFEPPATTAPETVTTATTAPVTTTTGVPLTTTTTAPGFHPIAGDDGRLTIALLGGDSGRGRVGIRTDTIIVVSVDSAGDGAVMFSVPRNLRQLPIPVDHPAHDAWGCGCLPGLANTIYAEGLANPALFPGGPNSGINAVKAIIGNLLDLEVDKVVLVALDGFVELIDALGGVEITVVKGVSDPNQVQPDGTLRDIVIPPGDYHFDGLTALAYARVRQQDSDYFRMDRQRCLLDAVAEQLGAVTLFQRLPEISAVARTSIVMDVRVAEFTNLIDLAAGVDTNAVVSLRFVPNAPDLAGSGLSYVTRSAAGVYPVANVDLIRERVRIALTSPPEEAITVLGAPSLDQACSTP